MNSTSKQKPPFPARFEIVERSLAAFASWGEDLGLCEFEDSAAFDQLKAVAKDMQNGKLRRAFEPCSPFKKEI